MRIEQFYYMCKNGWYNCALVHLTDDLRIHFRMLPTLPHLGYQNNHYNQFYHCRYDSKGKGKPVFNKPSTNCNDNIQWSSLSRRTAQRDSIIQCLYSAMSGHTQSAQTWITQFYLQITPCMPFVSQAFTGWRHPEVEGIWLELTTHLSTPKGWQVELVWLVDL